MLFWSHKQNVIVNPGDLIPLPDQSRIFTDLFWVLLVVMGRLQDGGKQNNRELESID